MTSPFHNLSPDKQLIAALAASLEEPIPRADVAEYAAELELDHEDGSPFTRREVFRCITDLQDCGVLLGDSWGDESTFLPTAAKAAWEYSREVGIADRLVLHLEKLTKARPNPSSFKTRSKLRPNSYDPDNDFDFYEGMDFDDDDEPPATTPNVRLARLYFLLKRTDQFLSLYHEGGLSISKILTPWTLSPEYLSTLPDPVLGRDVLPYVETCILELADIAEGLQWLSGLNRQQYSSTAARLAPILALAALLQGDLASAAKLNRSPEMEGAIALLRGDYATAATSFEAAYGSKQTGKSKRQTMLPGIFGVLGALVSLSEAADRNVVLTRARCKAGTKFDPSMAPVYALIETTAAYLEAHSDLKREEIVESIDLESNEFRGVFDLLRHVMLQLIFSESEAEILISPDTISRTQEAGWLWAAAQWEILATGDSTYFDKNGLRSLGQIFQEEPRWERQLDALRRLSPDAAVDKKSAGSGRARLVWFIEDSPYLDGPKYVLAPMEQKRKARGAGYSKGRRVALKHLAVTPPTFDGELLEQDLAILEHLREVPSDSFYPTSNEYEFTEKCWLAAVGHPNVFLADEPTHRIEITKQYPQMLVQRQTNEILIKIDMNLPKKPGIVLAFDGHSRLQVIEVEKKHLQLREVLGSEMRLPITAEEEVAKIIGGYSSWMTIHSDIEMTGAKLEHVEADHRLHVRLMPFGNGVDADVVLCPLGPDGPSCMPGHGAETLVAHVDEKKQTAMRDLREERQHFGELLMQCPVFAGAEAAPSRFRLNTADVALESLLELKAVEKPDIILEWPEGETFKVHKEVEAESMTVKANKSQDWFGIDGHIQVDDNLVLKLREVLDLLADQPGRFIKLPDGTYLALTAHFRKQLDEFHGIVDIHDDEIRVHPLAAPLIEEMCEEFGELETPPEWAHQLERLRNSEAFNPEPPVTLQAELRDYQLEGYRWLARLAHWGVGACLADDMGLGKTVQAIASILDRAPKGPTLVVAPTSVCTNWVNEARKFAPTLKPIMLHQATNRKRTIEALGPFDLLVTSYGLMQNELDSLTGVEFQTIVLDEAQAIKNMNTRRAKAAQQLKAVFKMLSTGTPIENHLAELWSLFNFILPGFLGTHESFDTRFATPIQTTQDKQARTSLRNMITPFILRRRKVDVLDELPPRTDISLKVQLSKEERAFYEALRRNVVEQFDEEGAEQNQIQILAEISKLRRACCNPKLVEDKLSIPSSKLAQLMELVEELRENGHQALIFSQFVGHLTLIREALDKQGIKYCYLDGSTSVKVRSEQIDSFQAGGCDLFLISLKAGGTGLNLTAADYVIHMDPWWNPAVEDQASDRAHRMGQKRPVTVYRLVAEGTIEEKIIALHNTKRRLAEDLLLGTAHVGKLDAHALLALLRD